MNSTAPSSLKARTKSPTYESYPTKKVSLYLCSALTYLPLRGIRNRTTHTTFRASVVQDLEEEEGADVEGLLRRDQQHVVSLRVRGLGLQLELVHLVGQLRLCWRPPVNARHCAPAELKHERKQGRISAHLFCAA